MEDAEKNALEAQISNVTFGSLSSAIEKQQDRLRQAELAAVHADLLAKMKQVQSMLETIKDNIPLIQSDVLMLMQSAEFDDLNAADGKKQFIKLIETSVNNMFKDGSKPFEMERAMITGFVIQ